MEAQLHEMKDERTALKNSYAQDRAVLVAAHAAEVRIRVAGRLLPAKRATQMSRLQQDAVAGKTYRGQLEASLVDKSVRSISPSAPFSVKVLTTIIEVHLRASGEGKGSSKDLRRA